MSWGIFVAADPSEAKPLANAACKGTDPPGSVVLGGMNMFDLFSLARLVDPSTDRLKELMTSSIRVSNGAAVPIPAQIRLCLSRLEEDKIPDLAETWSQAEEFRGMFPAAHLATFLKDLANLARQAIAADFPLLFLNI